MQYLKKEVKERILAAAVDEFKQKGYENSSIRNIAKKAEISLGNIYRYFPNKESLYLTITNPLFEAIQQVIEKKFDFHGPIMKEIYEEIIAFSMDYSDEIIIVRKGNSSHYENFINCFVNAAGSKLQEMMMNAFPQSRSTSKDKSTTCEDAADNN